MNSSSNPSATRSDSTLTSTSGHGWRNRAEAGMPKGAALILEGGFALDGLSPFLSKRLPPKGQSYYLPIHDTARTRAVPRTPRPTAASAGGVVRSILLCA